MKLNKFTCGVIAGAAIGILFAPSQGVYTRNAIANGLRNLKKGCRKLMGTQHAKEIAAINQFIDEKSAELSADTKKKLQSLTNDATSS